MLYGQNGSGKSTLANALVEGSTNILKDAGKFQAKQPILYKQREMFQITHYLEKETKNTEFLPLDENKNLYLVEYPHLKNSNLSKELANSCNM